MIAIRVPLATTAGSLLPLLLQVQMLASTALEKVHVRGWMTHYAGVLAAKRPSDLWLCHAPKVVNFPRI